MMVLFEYILVGLVSGSILILVSKVVMAKLLQRDTSYYDDEYDNGGEDNG